MELLILSFKFILVTCIFKKLFHISCWVYGTKQWLAIPLSNFLMFTETPPFFHSWYYWFVSLSSTDQIGQGWSVRFFLEKQFLISLIFSVVLLFSVSLISAIISIFLLPWSLICSFLSSLVSWELIHLRPFFFSVSCGYKFQEDLVLPHRG